VELLAGAASYRAFLDDATQHRGWAVAAAVVTLFVEGTPHERALFDPKAEPRPEPPLEKHPLVVHYGLPLESLALTKAHRGVEGDHRKAAWTMMLDHVPELDRGGVLDAMREAVREWKSYRDDVALMCGLTRSAP
jgi:pyrroloquinoline-quinone synthase